MNAKQSDPTTPPTPKHYIFIDRDGTLIEEKHYLSDPTQVQLIPGAAKALARLRDHGLGILLVTNQSGIGRGYFSLEDMHAVHGRVNALLAEADVFLDGIYFCPHTPDQNCNCRKPKTGLVDQAVAQHHFDPTQSFVIGDNTADIGLAKAVGATGILVLTGHGHEARPIAGKLANKVVNNLPEAVNYILKNSE